MIRLYRKNGKQPADWRETVEKALPDRTAYRRAAVRFERLHVNSAERRAGFTRFASHVLVVRKGKTEFPACWSIGKKTLWKMSHQKCAYCEVEINAPRAGQVEHFNPKALFPSLAYEWNNYFLACAGCNGAKSNKWPVKGDYVRPDRGDPAKMFRFLQDGTIHAARPDAKKTIEDFDLWREWLVERRRTHIRQMLTRLRLRPTRCIPEVQWHRA